MKHKFLLLSLSVASILPANPLMAQTNNAGSGAEDEHRGKSLEVVATAKEKKVSDILKKDRPKDNKSVPVPHFAIHTKDNNFVMSIGGQINTIVGADLGNDLYAMPNAGIGFVTSQIPVPAQEGKHSDFYINPLNANFDLQVVGFGGQKDQITGYMQFGTNGMNNTMQLKKAYMTWRGLTAGLKATLIQDDAACSPPTIDPEGPNGMVSTAAYEVSYKSPSYGGFSYAVGIDMPTYSTANGVYRGKDFKVWKGEEIVGQPVADPTAYNQDVPDIPMWIEYAATPLNRIRLSGIIRNFNYRDLLAGKHENTVGWGTMLSGNLNPVKPLILYGTMAYGEGIGNYIQDIAGIPVSFIPNDAKPGKMTASPMMGWMGGITYNFNSQWQANAMISGTRIWDVEPYAIAAASTPNAINNYKSAFYTAANLFYNVSSYFQLGVEYLYGSRQTWNVGKAHDNRIQMQMMFTL